MRHLRNVPVAIAFVASVLIFMVHPGTASASGSGRLRRDVLPTYERLKLNLDARKPGYSGSAHIDLHVVASVDSFQFHSEGLTIRRATLRTARGIVPSTHAQATPTQVTVRARSPLKPGVYTLDLDFTNAFSTQAQGIYRMDTGGESYCFTQFESDDARKAFPCWDEPSFKIPYQLTLVLPNAHRGVANTPIASPVLRVGRGLYSTAGFGPRVLAIRFNVVRGPSHQRPSEAITNVRPSSTTFTSVIGKSAASSFLFTALPSASAIKA